MTRQAYTIIELLVVVSIMVLLMALSAPAIVGVVQRQTMQQAAAHVLAAHDQAQLQAMARIAPATNDHFGVVLVQEPGQRAWVAMISSTPSNGPFKGKVLENSRGEAIARFTLPDGAAVWLGNQELSATATHEIAWFYQYRTGLPITMSASGPGRQPANVGTAAATAGTTTNPLFGLTIGGTPFILSTPVVAPDVGSDPGLSLRGRQLRQAIAIYASGITQVAEF